MSGECPACGVDELEVFHDGGEVPTRSNIVLTSRKAARAVPRGRLLLAFCPSCGLITNIAFDPTRAAGGCEETSQGFSSTFRGYAEELACHYVEQYGLHGQHVSEIGCGQGEFLAVLCRETGGTGTGIDPMWRPGRLSDPVTERLTFHAEPYNLGHGIEAGAFMVCRHTLEHVADVKGLLTLIRDSLVGRPTVLSIEVPDVTRILREVAFWDVYYEHCHYFSPGSLARLVETCGFALRDLRRVYADQYVLLDACLGGDEGLPSLAADLASLTAGVRNWQLECPRSRERLRARIAEATRGGRCAVCWGSGSKAVGLLSALEVEDEIPYVVDVNPHKQGQFVAGTGQEIISPQFLADLHPTTVFVMNAVYTEEIAADLTSLGIHANVEAL